MRARRARGRRLTQADPCFYLHHSFLDRVWARWQDRGLPARLSEITGFRTQTPPFEDVQLGDSLKMFGLIPGK